ncbi:MAG: tRNA lysidine(34) synthetase TilS [Oscillospiraceae bacterium]|nr:tRNA lysidine(34) synthetase TilS [Oscillospiraceae bacterium]
MLNKLLSALGRYDMLQPGDRLYCAVSGGADSMALLWAMYLLKDKLGIELCAAHFNHRLRGEESDRDEGFVRGFCRDYGIPLAVGSEQVTAGEKGLEAAAREARYRYFATLPGKLATAHTADDNAETVLLNMVRGTGLKGLGAIAPVRGQVIRPMLDITRQELLEFLEEYRIGYVEDSSNAADGFLRNRLRHGVMPLLKAENPRFSENVSQMAQRLRFDEEALRLCAAEEAELSVSRLLEMPQAVRSRAIARFLENCGVKEPQAAHICLTEALLNSENPSARAMLPGGVTVERCYDVLRLYTEHKLAEQILACPSETVLPALGLRISVYPSDSLVQTGDTFSVVPQGVLVLRSRRAGDAMRLSGGRKSLKKLLIDRKIPASERDALPVIADDMGILGVYRIGADVSRAAKEAPCIQIRIEKN